MYPTYICFDSEFRPEFKFKIIWGQIRSSEVKLGSKRSNKGQIGQSSRNMSNMHMFRLEILSKIQIEVNLRSNQVIKRSNMGRKRQIGVKTGQVVEICPIYICFDSNFCQKMKFKIIWGQMKSPRDQKMSFLIKNWSKWPIFVLPNNCDCFCFTKSLRSRWNSRNR